MHDAAAIALTMLWLFGWLMLSLALS